MNALLPPEKKMHREAQRLNTDNNKSTEIQKKKKEISEVSTKRRDTETNK